MQPDATLEELARPSVCPAAPWRSQGVEEARPPGKKKVLHADERDRPENKRKRPAFRKQMGDHPESLVFVDESGANTAMTRTYGRAPVGERVHGSAPGHWETVTLICGLRLSGVTAPLVIHGATDTAAFETYVEQVLAPQLHPGDVVVWDNLRPHKATAAVEAVETGRARTLIPLPPWSPDLDPIEEMYSKVKGALRSAGARTTEAVIEAIGSALKQVSPARHLGLVQVSRSRTRCKREALSERCTLGWLTRPRRHVRSTKRERVNREDDALACAFVLVRVTCATQAWTALTALGLHRLRHFVCPTGIVDFSGAKLATSAEDPPRPSSGQ